MPEAVWKERRSVDGIERNRLRIVATARAQRRLVALHREEFRALYNKERVALGLPALIDGARDGDDA